MVKGKSKGVKITLGGRSFVIACEEQKRDILMSAASMVEARLNEVQNHGKVIGLDRCALLAALNIANDLLEQRVLLEGTANFSVELQRIRTKIDTALDEQNQLSLEPGG